MITATEYQSVVCFLDDAHTLLGNVISEIYNFQITLDDTMMSTGTRASIQSVLSILEKKLENESITIVRFITALQQHVTENYGSVNLFLTDNSILVPQYIADISKSVGYTIAPASITTNCIN